MAMFLGCARGCTNPKNVGIEFKVEVKIKVIHKRKRRWKDKKFFRNDTCTDKRLTNHLPSAQTMS